MIIVRLMGGLGNQMFQYAAGRRLAEKRQAQLKLDKRWFTLHQSPNAPAVRHYELGCFDIKPSFATRTDLARIDVPPNTWKRRLYRKAVEPISPYREPETAEFFPEILEAPDNSYLEGYWQREDYFKDVEPLIRREFRFRSKLEGRNLDLAQKIQSSTSVSLHIRRGDYASNARINAFHGLTSKDYYMEAIRLMEVRLTNPSFFVISDDPAWSKANIKIKAPTVYVDHNTEGFEDMRLMSLCSHHIIANSSFSWWGAWLNPNKDKIVVAPKRWFADSKMNTEGRTPKSWIKL